MVKKLLKYEFASFAKTILPIEIVLLGIAVLTRIIQFFEAKSIAYNILNISSVIILIVAMIVTLVMTAVICIIRFYKNLFTAEGYLTLTLPVTHEQHIFAKLIFSVLASLFSLLSVIISFCVAFAGDVVTETAKAGAYLIKLCWKAVGVNTVFYALELTVLLIISVAASYLLFFTCMTVGQLANKARILLAIGVYFGYYVFRQIVGTIIVIIITIVDYEAFRPLLDWCANNIETAIHLGFISVILFVSILGTIFFLITRVLMKNKLNVE